MFLVIDPDGVVVRVIVAEAEFDGIRLQHMIERIRREIPRGLSQSTASALAGRKAQEILPRYKLVRLG